MTSQKSQVPTVPL